MSAIAPKPEGTGLSGRSALSRRSPVGPATGVASLRASHPGKPPSRPRGTYSEVPSANTAFEIAWERSRGRGALAGAAHARYPTRLRSPLLALQSWCYLRGGLPHCRGDFAGERVGGFGFARFDHDAQ